MKIPEFALRRIKRWCLQYMDDYPADFFIGGREDPYLIRWWVLPRNKWFNLYLHKIVKDDRDEALHDHPWINISLLVRGSYDEHTIADGGVEHIHVLREGHLKLRNPTAAHRLVVGGSTEPVITLFFTGPVWRHWGFHCRKGWRHWKDFVGFRSDHENVVGRGCGEMEGPGLSGGRIPLWEPLKRSSDARPS